jgi:hypothetical protein
MAIHEYPKGLDYKNGVQQINCLERDFGKVRRVGISSGSQCKIIDKGFILEYEAETQQWYKQKTLVSGELISPKDFSFLSIDWENVEPTDLDYVNGLTLYKMTVTHNLNTTIFNTYVYNSDDDGMVVITTSTDKNNIKITSDEKFDGKVVLI